MGDLFLLSERQMARISPHFPLSHGVPRVDDRRVVSGIVYVIRNGQRSRVGQVTASGEENFVLAKSITSGGGTLQLQAHAIGSTGAISSESINVRPGGMQITWTLENNLSRATLAFY